MIDASGCLTIEPLPGASAGWLYHDGFDWLENRNKIISVVVRNGVNVVLTPELHGASVNGMFHGCANLVKADLSGLNTSEVVDASYMFSDCLSLTDLNLSGWDTSKVADMTGMFSGCASLKALDVAGLNTSKVTEMGDMFSGCESLESLNLKSFDVSGVMNMRNMFSDCSGLTVLNVSGWSTSKVTDMSEMFSGCSSLVDLSLSGWDTSSVENMSNMFYYCTSLESLDLKHFDVKSVKNMSNMFCGCSNLISLDLLGWITSNVTSMDGMFDGCSSLGDLNLSSFDTSRVASTQSMFSNCSNLISITLGAAFAIEGYGSNGRIVFPVPSGNGLTGRWLSSDDGIAYTADGIPSKIAATYTAQEDGSDSWNQSGTCIWRIGKEGDLVIKPLSGQRGELSDSFSWNNSSSLLKSVSFEGEVVAPSSLNGMFSDRTSLTAVDSTGFDTSNVTSMFCMFSGCSSLESLNLTGFDTSDVTDMSNMFQGCSSLETLDLSIFNTSKVTDMLCMFSGCSSLSSLNLSGWNTASAVNMSNMFGYCSSLESLDLPGWNTSSVANMSGIFQGCSSLESINLSDFDTSKVVDMSDMFRDCASVDTLDLSAFNTSKVTDMSYMFSGCSSLETLDLSGWTNPMVADMSWMFNRCSALTALDLSNFGTSRVTNMSGMFGSCSSLVSLNLKSFDTANVENMSYMFYCSTSIDKIPPSKLRAIDLSSFSTSRVKSMFYMFWGCSSLESLDVSGFDTSRVTDTGWMFGDCSSLKSIDLSGWNTSKVVSMSSMFSDCSSLESLDVSRFDTSRVTDMYDMFDNCSSLKSIDLSSWNTSKVTSMSCMFLWCSSLESLDVSSFNTSKVTSMHGMFEGCSSLESLDLSSFDTLKVTDMASMLESCSGMRSVALGRNFAFIPPRFSYERVGLPTPSGDGFTGRWVSSADGIAYEPSCAPSNVAATYTTQESGSRAWNQFGTCLWRVGVDGQLVIKPLSGGLGELPSSGREPWAASADDVRMLSIEKTVMAPANASGMFLGLGRLESADLSGLDVSRVVNMSGMFRGCSSLRSLDLSGLDTSQATDMSSLFEGCSSLASLNLANFNTSKVTGMYRMFYGCSSLTELDLLSFNTANVKGGYNIDDTDGGMEYMFSGCSSLETLNLASFDTSKVTSMSGMFSGCSSLKTVSLGAKVSLAASATLPTPRFENATGLWVSSADGKAYAPDSIPNNVAATYTAQVKGETPKTAIDESMFTVDTAAKTYTGSPIEPSVSSATLQRGTDYTVVYGENVNTGEGAIVITGTGSYTGQVSCTFRIDPKRVVAPEAVPGLVYNGEEQVGVAASGGYTVANESATNAGSYTATASLKDKKNFVWSGKDNSNDLTIPWSIAKADPAYVPPEPISATEGQTLGDLGLPEGFSWQDNLSTSVGDAGEHEFMATFAPEDTSNYNVVENVPVKVNVSKSVDGWNAVGDCVWKVDDQGCLVIKPADGVSGTLENCAVDIEDSPYDLYPVWFGSRSAITSARFEPGVKASADGLDFLFAHCGNLREVDLSNLDTTEATSLKHTFYRCESLSSIVGLGSFESKVKPQNMHEMCAGCESLESFVFSGIDGSNHTEANNLFSGCISLKSIDFGDFNAPGMTEFGGVFANCVSLAAIDLSHFNVANASYFYGAFQNCSSLKSLDFSKFDTRRAWVMSNMLEGCSSLESVTLGKNFTFDGSGTEWICSLPTPSGELHTGKWVDVETGEVYSAADVPDGKVVTYRAQRKLLESDFTVDVSEIAYSGEAVVGRVSSDSLEEGTDYDVAYSDNVDAGTAAIAITGKGLYAGELDYTFNINPVEITADMISDVPSKTEATGEQLTPEPTVSLNGKVLEKDNDYTLSYGENMNPGKGTVTVSAIEGGNFTGSATIEFEIEKKADPVNPDPGTGGGGTDPAPTPDPGTGGGSGGGGGAPAPAPQQFAVTYHLDGGVNAASNPATFAAGTAVALAAPTRDGYEFLGWYADSKFEVRVTEIPADASGDVDLWAKWALEAAPAPTFPDVDYSESSWYGKAVTYVAEKGLITGYTGGDKAGLFGVGDTLTRAQLATILWRNACPDEAASYDPASAKDATGIAGSADGQYYTAAANWAVKNGVISGYVREDGSHDFAANDDVSFEQLVTILARLCATDDELAAAGSDLSAFADGGDASGWSRAAFAWAAGKGLVQGYNTPSGKMLSPGEDVARERVAVVLMRAFELGLLK